MTIDNLTDALQRHLGIQQAQSIHVENITGDAIARLHGLRGDVSRIQALWGPIDTAGADLVQGWSADDHGQDLRQLRGILDVSFKVQSFNNGKARSFLPLSPRLVNADRVSSLYRDVGRSVLEGLWADDDRLVEMVRMQTKTWEGSHPLGRLLAPLAAPKDLEPTKGEAHLGRVLIEDDALRAWRDRVVRQDWRAWCEAATHMSADEQLETMTSLIGLHLFVALMRRLAVEENGARTPTFFFAAVAGQARNPVAARGATSFYAHWRDRADMALRIVASRAIDRLGSTEPALRRALATSDWTEAGLWRTLDFGRRVRKQKEKYELRLEEKLEQARRVHGQPAEGQVRQMVEDTLCEVFSAGSGVTSKVKDYLRTTGGAAGLVGPIDRGVRKRFLLDERGLTLLARLHARRSADEVGSNEEDHQSVGAFLDDVFDRYGIILTLDREQARNTVYATDEAKRLARMLPNEDAMRRNGEQLELRLDALRLVRRYSDASTVIHVNQ